MDDSALNLGLRSPQFSSSGDDLSEMWPTGVDHLKKRKFVASGQQEPTDSLVFPSNAMMSHAHSPATFSSFTLGSTGFDFPDSNSVFSDSNSSHSSTSSMPPLPAVPSMLYHSLGSPTSVPASIVRNTFQSNPSWSEPTPIISVTAPPPLPSQPLSSSSSSSSYLSFLTKSHAHYPKSCAFCAITLCQQCLDGGRQPTPRSCHVPEHGRSVCATCASSHRALNIDAARALILPLSLVSPFHAAFAAASAGDKVSSSSLSAAALKPLDAATEEQNARFTTFYAQLNGNSRCFDIFDAADTSLWAEQLAFNQVYLFPTAEAAERMRAAFSQYLQPLPPDPSEANRSSLLLRLCAQCSAFQVQYPSVRQPASSDDLSGLQGRQSMTSKRLSNIIPNFYSASLCRKSNASHLKKQRGLKPSADDVESVHANGSSAFSRVSQSSVAAAAAASAAAARLSSSASSSSSLSVPSSSQPLSKALTVSESEILHAAASAAAPGSRHSLQPSSAFSTSVSLRLPSLSPHLAAMLPSSIHSIQPFAGASTTSGNSSTPSPLAPLCLPPRSDLQSRSISPNGSIHVNVHNPYEFASMMSGKLKQSGFRKRMAFQLLWSHRFPCFRAYLRTFPIDRAQNLANWVRFELQMHASYLYEMADRVYFAFDPERQSPSDAMSGMGMSGMTAGMGFTPSQLCSVPTAKLSPRGRPEQTASVVIVQSVLSKLLLGLMAFEPLVGHILAPLSLPEPSIYISYRFLRYWSDVMKSNAEALAGIPNSALQYHCPAERPLTDLQHEGAALLDELDALKELEMEDARASGSSSSSPLVRFILHVEVLILWMLGTLTARVFEARRRYIVQLRSFEMHQQHNNGSLFLTMGGGAGSEEIAFNDLVTAERAVDHPPSSSLVHSLPPLEKLDPISIYERAVGIAIQYADGSYDLNTIPELELHMPNVPKFSMLASAFPVFFSQAMENIGAELTLEMKHPRYAFTAYQQSMFNAAAVAAGVVGTLEDEIPSVWSEEPVEGAEEFLAWTICFTHEYESAPSFLPCSFFTLQFASHFVPPTFDPAQASSSSPTSPTTTRVSRLTAKLGEIKGRAWTSMPRTSATALSSLHSFAPSIVQSLVHSSSSSSLSLPFWSSSSPSPMNPYSASTSSSSASSTTADAFPPLPQRSARSMEGMRLLLLALGYAQKIEDACSSAVCILQLAHFFIYWIPRHSLSLRMLTQLDAEIDDLLQHMPPLLGPAFERACLVACQQCVLWFCCQQQCKLVIQQFRLHRLANLTSPFFIGQSIPLKFSCGVIPGIVCSVDVSAPFMFICEHPHFGLIWALAMRSADVSALCADSSRWCSLDSDRAYDSAMGGTFYGYGHRLLLHEMRLGRYTFQGFLADVQARERHIAELQAVSF